jgi:flagellar basal body rod protein FlgG
MFRENFGRERALPPRQVLSFMDHVSSMAAAGLRSRTEALDLLSNNLANVNTGGYKLDREFYSLFQEDALAGANGMPGATMPMIQKQWTDFKQGDIQPTGNALNVALSGKGFFKVKGPSDDLYTRNGMFKISPVGVLTTLDGYPVAARDGKKIQTTSQAPLEITADGTVRQSGETLGQIEVVDFANPSSALSKIGSSYFRSKDAGVKTIAAAGTTMEQGKIETSNVAPAESAVRIVELMRQYEMLTKAVSISAEMNKKTNDEVARVGS